MNFLFSNGTPKQQLVMREFKKMAVTVRFGLKHCFPIKPALIGKGFASIQHHHKHLKISMKDVLFQLATSFKLMNPIRGVVPGSPSWNSTEVGENDDIDRKIEAENSAWLKTAKNMPRNVSLLIYAG